MSDQVNLAKTIELDPVCGMTVDPATAREHVEHAGKTYHFCSTHCVAKFQQDPEKYLHPPKEQSGALVTLGVKNAKLATVSSTKVKDPVCGMDVDPATAKHRFEHAGQTYYFCCGGCLEKFRSDPERYLKPKTSTELIPIGAAPASPVTQIAAPHSEGKSSDQRAYVCPMCPEVRQVGPGPCPSCGMALDPESPFPVSKIEYTCPMHPEIIRSEPGSCPICGMALEPRTITAHEEENPELRDMSRRFWISLILTAPLLVIAMGSMLWPHLFMGEAFLNHRRVYDPTWLPWF